MSILAVIASLAWTIYVEHIDAKVSTYYPLYTTGEANIWARDKDGYYSLSKSIRNTAIVLGSLLAIAVIFPFTQLVIAGVIALMGVAIFSKVNPNKRKQKSERAKQADYLEHFTVVSPTSIKPFKGEWILPTFYDIRTPILGPTSGSDGALEMVRAAGVLTEMFLVLKANPQWWWDLNRAKKVKELMARV
jgi:hypothetical protein